MLLITERPGHARSLISSADLSDIDGIATVGGDGLLYEVVNGLRCRRDSNRISDIPLGVIAGGSGNGLARSIAAYSGDNEDYKRNPVVETTLAIARGKVLPVNLSEVELDGRKIYSFLSTGWGLLADIDVESEVLRSIGELRFYLWSFLRVAKLRVYNAQLSFTREGVDDNNGNTHKQETIEGDFISVYSSCQSHIGQDLVMAPNAASNDGLIHLTFIKGDVGRHQVAKFLIGMDTGEHVDMEGVTYVKCKEFSLRSEGGIKGTLTIDGERVIGELIKVRLCPKPLNVFSL
jgi:sphingosine kinase